MPSTPHDHGLPVMLLSSRLGMAAYMVLPNDWSWRLLSGAERARVLEANVAHNSLRPDYADPTRYDGGRGFDSPGDRRASLRGSVLGEFLDRVQPSRVVEVGPGSGFYTRLIVEHPAVREFVGVDVNRAFLEYLRPRLESSGRSVELVEGSLARVAPPVDAVVLLSSVHHIPNRVDLFQQLHAMLRPGGAVLAADPTHYILRIRHVLRKCCTPDYLAAKVHGQHVSTHNMCSLAEYRRIVRRTGFGITRIDWHDQPRRIQRLRARGIPLGPWWRWWSQEMTMECRRS